MQLAHRHLPRPYSTACSRLSFEFTCKSACLLRATQTRDKPAFVCV